MKNRPLAYLVFIAAAAFSCEDPAGKNTEPAGFLVVNRQVADSEIKVSPDGGQLEISVTCDADWNVSELEEYSWISPGSRVREEKKNTWTLPVTVDPNEGEYPRSGILAFTADEYRIELTLSQTAPDPLTLNKNPGLYGIPGGDVLVTPGRQSSSFHYGDRWSYRVVDPVTLSVYALGNIPESISSGDVIPFLSYKAVSQGLSESNETFRNVTVVRSTPTMVWLRQSESVYFIVDR